MIEPINGHLLIEPVPRKTFLQSDKGQFEEIGIVISAANPALIGTNTIARPPFKPGMRVYFDSWLAAKYPKGDSAKEFYWLVKEEDVRAVEYVDEEIPE